MGGQAKAKVSHQQRSSKSSSSSGNDTSAPRSVISSNSIARYDGPNSPQAKSPQVQSPKSPVGVAQSPHQAVTSTRTMVVTNKNLDLGSNDWSVVRGYDALADLPTRPKVLSKLGQETKIALNTFNVAQYPSATVYQYEVMIGNGAEKRGIIDNVWKSRAVKDAIGQVIFDGDRLAWGLRPIAQEIRKSVDLDQEHGRTPKPGKNNIFRVVIRQSKTIDFEVLKTWLAGRISFNNACLEAINCLDHILREHPGTRLQAVKRAFFPRAGDTFDLGGGVHAVKGAYQSMRPVLGPQGPTLSINVDVANGTFFQSIPLLNLILLMTNCRDANDLQRLCTQQSGAARIKRDIKRLQKKRVIATHRQGAEDEYVIDSFDFRGAKGVKFIQDGRQVSVYDYFQRQYNKRIAYPDLPLIKNPKGSYMPIELVKMKANQVCRYKLDEKQTANMIKFAVTPPSERWSAIEAGLRALNWGADPVLNAFGVKVSATRTVVPARVIQAPKVVFGANGSANPGTSGRWDLKGKKFLTSNTAPLKSWGVMVISGSRGGKPEKSIIENFIKAFVNAYVAHGGKVETKQPPMLLSTGTDVSAWVTTAWNTIGSQFQARPQMIMFILPDKASEVYNRIKRSMDCRFGAVSSCVQYSHAQKAAPQYLSNVLMKFNAKLGGTTCRAVGAKSAGATGLFSVPTIVIGADVSHAAPGSLASSCAAITVSMDQLGVKYAAAVENNGYRVEMITEANIKKHLAPLLQHWCSNVNNGKLPQRVIYIRDGVSEGQYNAVLQQELHYIKSIFDGVQPNNKVQFIVIIAGKRHHIRFFPQSGDRNGNPFPGTLVESGATHPFENDFYLCSHAAIKGTARPVHYQVIRNDASMSNDEIYTLLYEHSYQYLRATTPVSVHPAVYYAHLASNRGVCHDPKFGSNSDDSSGQHTSAQDAVAEPFLPMPNEGGIRTVPWFI